MEEEYVEGDDVVRVTLWNSKTPFIYGEDLKEVISWFREKLKTVPEAYRDAVQCEFYGLPGYDGDADCLLRIWYRRPATDVDRAIWKQHKERERQEQMSYAREILAKHGEQVS